MAAHPFNIDTSKATKVAAPRLHNAEASGEIGRPDAAGGIESELADAAAVREFLGQACTRFESAGTWTVIRIKAAGRRAIAA